MQTNEEFRKSAPESLGTVPFNLPDVYREELPNGIKLVLVEDRRHPMTSVRLALRVGDIDDPAGKTGVSSATASMITEGTERFSSKELAEKTELLGSGLSASSGLDNTIVKATTLSEHLEDVFELMAEVVRNPVFPESELNLYKQNTIEGLKFQRSQPDFLSDEQVGRLIYGSHPYGINSPSPEEIEAITQGDLVEFHSKSYRANYSTIVAIGDFDIETFRGLVLKYFGDWETGDIQRAELPEIPVRTARSLTVVDRPGSSQSNIVLANPGLKRNHPDYFDVLVMNQILGAGASSRLFMNLREEKGYTYGAYSRIYSKRHAGTFEASSEVRTSVTGDSLKEFFFELNRIRDEHASEEELIDAQNYLAGVFPIRAETQGGLTGLVVSKELYDLPDTFLDEYRDNVRAVTLERVKEAATKYIDPENLAIVIVGDAGEVLSQAGEYAEKVEVYDSEGNVLNPDDFIASGEDVDVQGEWKLEVSAQGQKIPLTMVLVSGDDGVSGKLESMMGDGTIEGGKVSGNKFTASATSEFQGQEIEFSISGRVVSDEMTGTLTSSIVPMPLEFTGNKI